MISWSGAFLKKMMKKLGFSDVWISTMMTCVSIASYAVLINGRQGDPLSLYLYLLCAEGLSCLLYKVKSCSNVKRVKVACGSPSINHLFFVNDSLVFYRVNTIEWQTVQKLLDRYETTSG